MRSGGITIIEDNCVWVHSVLKLKMLESGSGAQRHLQITLSNLVDHDGHRSIPAWSLIQAADRMRSGGIAIIENN